MDVCVNELLCALATQSQVVPIDDTVVQCHSLHKSIAGKLSYLRNQNELDGK